MSIAEAIKHAEEVAEEKEEEAWEAELQEEYKKIKSCKKCAAEHRQLAEWLKDYKRCGDAISRLDKIQQTLYALDKEVADKEVTRDYWDGFCKVFNAIEVILDENSD